MTRLRARRRALPRRSGGVAGILSTVVAAIGTVAAHDARRMAILLAGLVTMWTALAVIGRRRSAPRDDDLDAFLPQLDDWTQLKL